MTGAIMGREDRGMFRRLLCAVAAVPLLAACSGGSVTPRGPAEAADELLGDALPKVQPYELNGPRKLAGWTRDAELEQKADFTILASALPQGVRDKLTGIKAGYYKMPGSTRVMDRFFYVRGTLKSGDAAAVTTEVKRFAEKYRSRTVSAAEVPFGKSGVKAVQVGFGLGAHQNPFKGGGLPVTNDSVVWTDGTRVGLITMSTPATSDVLANARKIHAGLG